METTPVSLPKPIPTTRFRPPKKNVPQTLEERNQVLQVVREYVAKHNPVPAVEHAHDEVPEMKHAFTGETFPPG